MEELDNLDSKILYKRLENVVGADFYEAECAMIEDYQDKTKAAQMKADFFLREKERSVSPISSFGRKRTYNLPKEER